MRAIIVRRFIIGGTFFLLGCFLFAQNEEAYAAYYKFENAIFEQILTKDQINSLYRALLPQLLVIEPAENRYFFLARTEFFRGIACAHDFMIEYNKSVLAAASKKPPKLKIPQDLKVEMSVYFSRALELCELALVENPTADAYLGKSMIVLSEGGLAGCFATFVSMFKFLDLSKLALKTDPDNFEAMLMQAVTRAFPPPPFGKPQKGIDEIFDLMVKITPQTPKMDLFICYVSLASAYANLGQNDRALFWIHQAQAVYPQNNSLKPFERKLLEK